MNYKPLTGILLLLCAIGLARADEPKVSVVDPDGKKTSFEKSQVATIKLHADKVEIVDKDGKSTEFNKRMIAHILLADTESGIEMVTESGNAISIKANRDHITISNAAIQTSWCLTDISGTVIRNGVCMHETETVDIRNIPSGIYFLSTGGKTLKFIKP